jgi:hypothetical protein
MSRWSFVFFPAVFVSLFLLAVFSSGIYDPGDGVMHYMFAHYSWKHPALLMDHWGKPLFTLLSSPFAQFGYKGILFFNLLCLCGTGWLAWKTAEAWKIPFAWAAVPLSIFAPIALPVGISGLTEPLFALVLVAGVYFTAKGRFGIAAIVISFLPFARTEGFFLAPLFGLVFLLRRDYISILLLAAGTLLYSVLGYFVHHDFLWIIHQNPYVGAEKIYGRGPLLHFLALNEFIWGWGLLALLIAAVFVYLFRKKFAAELRRDEMILSGGIFLLFLAMHSIFWWKGLFGSLGLHRVMAGTIPLAVLTGMRGFQLFSAFIAKRNAHLALLAAIIGLQFFLAWRQHPLPLKATHQEEVLNAAAGWIRTHENVSKGLLYSQHPFLAFATDHDPWNSREWQAFSCTCPEVKFKNGDLVLWESHFAQFEIPFPVQLLEQDTRFRELARFGEIPASKEEGNRKFAVVIFEYHVEKSLP